MQIKKNNCIDYYIFIKKQHFTSFSAEEYHIERHTRHHHCTNWISVSIGEMMRALLISILFLYAAFLRTCQTKPSATCHALSVPRRKHIEFLDIPPTVPKYKHNCITIVSFLYSTQHTRILSASRM